MNTPLPQWEYLSLTPETQWGELPVVGGLAPKSWTASPAEWAARELPLPPAQLLRGGIQDLNFTGRDYDYALNYGFQNWRALSRDKAHVQKAWDRLLDDFDVRGERARAFVSLSAFKTELVDELDRLSARVGILLLHARDLTLIPLACTDHLGESDEALREAMQIIMAFVRGQLGAAPLDESSTRKRQANVPVAEAVALYGERLEKPEGGADKLARLLERAAEHAELTPDYSIPLDTPGWGLRWSGVVTTYRAYLDPLYDRAAKLRLRLVQVEAVLRALRLEDPLPEEVPLLSEEDQQRAMREWRRGNGVVVWEGRNATRLARMLQALHRRLGLPEVEGPVGVLKALTTFGVGRVSVIAFSRTQLRDALKNTRAGERQSEQDALVAEREAEHIQRVLYPSGYKATLSGP